MTDAAPVYDHWVLKPEWTDVPLGPKLRMSLGVYEGCILVSRITGQASPGDLEHYRDLVEGVIAEAVGRDRAYAHVTDWSGFKGGPHGVRKGLVLYLNDQSRLRAYVNCNTSLLLRLSVNAAKRFYAAPYEVLFCDGLANGVRLAGQVLDLPLIENRIPVPACFENAPTSAWRPSTHPSDPSTVHASGLPQIVDDDDFAMESELLEGDIVFTRVRGFMRVRHVDAAARTLSSLAEKVVQPGRPYYIMADIHQVKGGSLRGRRQFVEAVRRIYRSRPFRMYVFFGAKGFARAGIHLARLTVPFRVEMADDFESAMAVIREDRRRAAESGRLFTGEQADGDTAGGEGLQVYVDDVLRYLAAIEWDKTDTGEASSPFSPDHPFSAVFDAIDLIRTDMHELFRARQQADLQRRAMEEKLIQSQKMEAVGLLAGGVAHDLNNVLSGIVSYPELLLMDMAPDAPLREPLEVIRASGEKAAAIVADLQTLSRRGASVLEPVDVNGLVQAYLTSTEHRALGRRFPRVKVMAEIGRNVPAIRGSASHLRKSLASLVANAVEAYDGDGTVRIVTAGCTLDTPVSGYDAVAAGEYVRLSIIDKGRGIAEKDLPRIFEPFYTKKIMGGSGTGLGMAVVWGTVEDHSGYIDVVSREGQGTAFHLYFPAMQVSLPVAETTAVPETIAGRGERVLVVDDLPQQREIAVEMLRRMGYRPAAVESGEAALAYLENTPVNLVVLDMIMDPGMDGMETYRRIRRRNADQKAIVVSGYADDRKVKLTQAMGAGAFVKKPYTYQDFGRAVRTELDRT